MKRDLRLCQPKAELEELGMSLASASQSEKVYWVRVSNVCWEYNNQPVLEEFLI